MKSNIPTKVEDTTIDIEPGTLWSIGFPIMVNTLLKWPINPSVDQRRIKQLKLHLCMLDYFQLKSNDFYHI